MHVWWFQGRGDGGIKGQPTIFRRVARNASLKYHDSKSMTEMIDTMVMEPLRTPWGAPKNDENTFEWLIFVVAIVSWKRWWRHRAILVTLHHHMEHVENHGFSIFIWFNYKWHLLTSLSRVCVEGSSAGMPNKVYSLSNYLKRLVLPASTYSRL